MNISNCAHCQSCLKRMEEEDVIGSLIRSRHQEFAEKIFSLRDELPLDAWPPDQLLIPLELLHELHRVGVHVPQLVLQLAGNPVLGRREGILVLFDRSSPNWFGVGIILHL